MAVRMPLEQLDYEEIRPSMRCLGCHCREGERDRHLGPSQCSQKSTANSNRRTIFLWALNRTRGVCHDTDNSYPHRYLHAMTLIFDRTSTQLVSTLTLVAVQNRQAKTKVV
jgi:hypothetical protein